LHIAANGLSRPAYFVPGHPTRAGGALDAADKSAILDFAYYFSTSRFYLKHFAQIAGIYAIAEPYLKRMFTPPGLPAIE
jgi:hypothetical protein